MFQNYSEKLVSATTEDGLILPGVVFRPPRARRSAAIVWVHGLTGNFSGQRARCVPLAERGFVVVNGDNRGHDFGALIRRTEGTPLLAGGGWELFDQSPYDVGAWIDLAESLGFPGVILGGHSLGALKVAYYQATRNDPRVLGLVAASPPVPAGRLNVELVAEAERLVREGRGQDLLPWGSTSAGAGTVSAQTYLNRVQTNVDVYGFVTPNPRVLKIQCPILAFYGTDEPNVGTAADLEKIRRNALFSAGVETQMIEGADHVYSGHEEDVGALIVEWASRVLRQDAARRTRS